MTIATTKRAGWVPNSDGDALSRSVHRNKVRLRAGNQWLHWSGSFLTDNPKHAWSGTIEQARACRRTFDAAAGCKMVGVQ